MEALNHDTAFSDFFAATAEEPIFVILGVQGSGTNLLSRLMRHIFGFSVVHDGAVILRGALTAGRQDPAAATRAFHRLERLTFPSAWDRKRYGRLIRPNEPFKGVGEAFRRTQVDDEATFARFFYAYRAHNLGTTRMAIKSDDLWEVIEDIDKLLPRRRTILLTRDFRDNALSVSAKNFGPIEPACAAAYVKHHFAFYHAEYERRRAEAMHVTYEALLAAPVEFARRFQEQFEVEPRMSPEEAVEKIGLRTTNVRKWERMPVRDLRWCEGILRSELEGYGYGVSRADAAEPTSWEWAQILARDTAGRIPQKLGSIGRRLRR